MSAPSSGVDMKGLITFIMKPNPLQIVEVDLRHRLDAARAVDHPRRRSRLQRGKQQVRQQEVGQRVTARARRLRKGVAAAEPLFLRTISLLEQGPNRWELGVAYYDAAVALPHRRAQLLARAREIFTAIGARAELRRVERLEGEVPKSQARGAGLRDETWGIPKRTSRALW